MSLVAGALGGRIPTSITVATHVLFLHRHGEFKLIIALPDLLLVSSRDRVFLSPDLFISPTMFAHLGSYSLLFVYLEGPLRKRTGRNR
jgi:hypothetical protein